jgi:hypothetical protein
MPCDRCSNLARIIVRYVEDGAPSGQSEFRNTNIRATLEAAIADEIQIRYEEATVSRTPQTYLAHSCDVPPVND